MLDIDGFMDAIFAERVATLCYERVIECLETDDTLSKFIYYFIDAYFSSLVVFTGSLFEQRWGVTYHRLIWLFNFFLLLNADFDLWLTQDSLAMLDFENSRTAISVFIYSQHDITCLASTTHPLRILWIVTANKERWTICMGSNCLIFRHSEGETFFDEYWMTSVVPQGQPLFTNAMQTY